MEPIGLRAARPGENGSVAHAQFSFGNGMVMLGSIVESKFGRLMKQPDESGGAVTQSIYAVVSDPDAICRERRRPVQ
ncbi:MAG: hypothetical protein JO114_07950 [Planctomycetaceae bacterium]|nr:hypothetical protein [Planctomycetaceae bacterium]